MLIDLAVLLSTIERFEEQMFDQVCQLILATKAIYSISGFYNDDDQLLRHLQPSIHELQQIVISHTLRGRLFTMAHDHKFAGLPRVTRMHATLQQTYNCSQMDDDVICAVQNLVHCAKIEFHCTRKLTL